MQFVHHTDCDVHNEHCKYFQTDFVVTYVKYVHCTMNTALRSYRYGNDKLIFIKYRTRILIKLDSDVSTAKYKICIFYLYIYILAEGPYFNLYIYILAEGPGIVLGKKCKF